MKNILNDIMQKLNRAFCSEADFQHTLAWELHKRFNNSEILLEYPAVNPDDKTKTIYHDIYVKVDDKIHLIELKYRTKGIKEPVDIYGQKIKLKNHSANDLGCCFFWLDVKRIEETPVKYTSSYCIMLTNDGLYRKGPRKDTFYENFSIADKRHYKKGTEFEIKKGENNAPPKSYWPEKAKNMTLKNNYNLQWQKCKNIDNNDNWQYLLLEIKTPNHE